MKTLVRWLLRLAYGFRVQNESVLESPGPLLLIPNHVSWLDWLFVAVCLSGDWRFVVSRVTAESSWLRRRIMLNRRTFPIDTDSPYGVKRMAEHLKAGGRLVLFAEGWISRTGTLMKLFDGTGFLLHKTGARVITCYLRGAYRLPRSPNPAPKKWFPTVTVHFSELLTPPRLPAHTTTAQARAVLTDWVRQHMLAQQFSVEMALAPRNLPAAIAETARRQPRKIILEDATQKPIRYRRLLLGAALLARHWRRQLQPDVERVGVLLPNVIATPVTLLSLWGAGKVPAVLNFSTGTATMLACVRVAGLKQIITSRAFLERVRLDVQPLLDAGLQLIYLEDVRAQVTACQKLAAMLWPRLRTEAQPDQPALVLFTSGSEAEPKAVELSHGNLLANIRQLLVATDFDDADRVFNCLPLFHSFGLTAGTLAPLVRGVYVFLYPTPLHYRTVPTMLYYSNCTVFLSTNTFLRGYLRKAHPYDFRRVRLVFAGGEKLQPAVAAAFAERFGVRVLEGYGATECSPVISANTPLANRPGSVGRLLPGIEYRIEPVEGLAEGGRLLLRGPNVMRGYLNAEANAQFRALGGWYDTGDIARMDADGFLYIVDRVKRFAKVSGEMISLTAVEEALTGAFPQYGLRCTVAVLSRPDEAKGEALLAVTNEPRLTLEQIRGVLRAKGFSNLCVPHELKHVPHIPMLASGKIHHRQLAARIGGNAR